MSESPRGKTLLAQLRDQKTDPFDTHPAPAERLAILSQRTHVVAPRADDQDAGTSLIAIDLNAWLCDATAAMFERPVGLQGPPPPLELVTWEEIPTRAFEPRTRNRAQKISDALRPMLPAGPSMVGMFAHTVAALEQGRTRSWSRNRMLQFRRQPSATLGASTEELDDSRGSASGQCEHERPDSAASLAAAVVAEVFVHRNGVTPPENRIVATRLKDALFC